MVEVFREKINEAFKGQYDFITIEEFGKTACDYGNEYYLTVCFEQGDVKDGDELWNDNQDEHKKNVTEGIEKILGDDIFEYGDYCSTLECVTYGNNTMIAMVLLCK